jgi:hypothetical protein
MRRVLAIAFAVLVTGAVVPDAATGAAITLTGALDYWACPAIPLGQPTRVYVVAELYDQACGGITGAEFRIAGFPTLAENWIVVPAWPPGVQPTGDPFVEGVRLQFPCAAPKSGVVVLFAFDVIALAPISNRMVSVVAHQMASGPFLPCPLLTLCDENFSYLCVAGSVTWLNDTTGSCYCNDGCVFDSCPPLAVAPGTWSQVKDLYRP